MNHEQRLMRWKRTTEGKSHCKQFVKHLKRKSRKEADVVKRSKEEIFSRIDKSCNALTGAIVDYEEKVQGTKLS